MKNSKTVKMIKDATESQGLYAMHFMELVELIKDKSVKSFVRDVLINHTPEYFWITPASKSGKFHNEDECGEGGLLLHVKRAVNMAVVLMKGLGWYDHRCQEVKEEKLYNYNVVLAAIILHDILTAGFVGREKRKNGDLYTDPMHPYYVREALRFKKFDNKEDGQLLYKFPFFDDVMRAIEGHYGYWSVMPYTANLEDAQSPEFIVYMADYIASRKLDEWFKI